MDDQTRRTNISILEAATELSSQLQNRSFGMCFINSMPFWKTDIAKITWHDYIILSQNLMPRKLYKYFPDTISPSSGKNHSRDALTNNTVYLQSPILFDDPYDCTICFDGQQFYLRRLQYYAELCGFQYDKSWDFNKLRYEFAVNLYPYSCSLAEWETVFHIQHKENDVIDLTHQNFALGVWNNLRKHSDADDQWQRAISETLFQEYQDKHSVLVGKFRVSCFTTSPFSMLMWSHYANNHKGFCVEYDIPIPNKENIELLQNLFPVIYSDERVSVLEQLLEDLRTPNVSEDVVWSIYKYGLLTKSLPWGYQNEWRLISLDNMLSDKLDYNCSFFPISKVYLGAKMDGKAREEIIKTCAEKSIPSVCVIPAMATFSMQECPEKMIKPDCAYKKLLS